jgi:hypothetical protein
MRRGRASPLEIDRDCVAAEHQDADPLALLRQVALSFFVARTLVSPW